MSRFLILEKTIFSNKIFSNIICEEFIKDFEIKHTSKDRPTITFHQKYEDFGSENDFTDDDLFRLHFFNDKILIFRKTYRLPDGKFSIMIFCYVILNHKKINKNNIKNILKELDNKYVPLLFYEMPHLSYYNISYNKNYDICTSSYMCTAKYLKSISLCDFKIFKSENKIEDEIKLLENYSLKLKSKIENT